MSDKTTEDLATYVEVHCCEYDEPGAARYIPPCHEAHRGEQTCRPCEAAARLREQEAALDLHIKLLDDKTGIAVSSDALWVFIDGFGELAVKYGNPHEVVRRLERAEAKVRELEAAYITLSTGTESALKQRLVQAERERDEAQAGADAVLLIQRERQKDLAEAWRKRDEALARIKALEAEIAEMRERDLWR
jgi:hypothetical protein